MECGWIAFQKATFFPISFSFSDVILSYWNQQVTHICSANDTFAVQTQLPRHKIWTQKICWKQIVSSKNENIISDHPVQSEQNKPKVCSEIMSIDVDDVFKYLWYEHFFAYYLLRSQPCNLYAASNTVISPDFTMWKFYEKPQLRTVSGDLPETLRKLCLSKKLFTPENLVKLRYFTEC